MRGFTLIEMLVTLGLMGMVLATGVLMSTDGFIRARVRSDRDLYVTVLRKARMEAMTGTTEGTPPADHGVMTLQDTYVLFEGTSYASRNSAADEFFPRDSYGRDTWNEEVVFAAGSGGVAQEHVRTMVATGTPEYWVLVHTNGGIDQGP